MSHARLLPLALLIGFATTANAADPQPPVPLEPPDIEVKTWVLLEYRTSEGLTAVDKQSRPARLRFDQGQLSAVTGCNRVTGSYVLDGSTLTIGEGMASTRMGCPEPLMQQEKAIIQALRDTAAAARSGDRLELKRADGEVLLRLEIPSTGPVTGRTWVLEAFAAAPPKLAPPLKGSEITLRLDSQGQASGRDGCSEYTTGYILDTRRLAVGPIAAKGEPCSANDGRAEQSERYAAALGKVTGYRLDSGKLVLLDGSGDPIARFASQPPDVPGSPR